MVPPSEPRCAYLAVGLCLLAATTAPAASQWDVEYHGLNERVEQAWSEPKGDPPQLEPYLRWMEIKAKDRDDVKALLDEATRLSSQKPSDEVLRMWVNRFSGLHERAQGSGMNTVNGAVMRLMRVRDPKWPKHGDWQQAIWRLREYGRPILLKAQETGFVTPGIRRSAQCMINFSIRDVEGNPRGLGVYEGREGTFVIPPSRDFDVDCEPRSSFTYTAHGEPSEPTDVGLDWINQVREEARWWQLTAEERDATDLMEEFFQDSMCKVPPNRCDKGHRRYRELAEKYRLPRAIEYNEGFYATIFGKVEVVSSSGRRPAQRATVTVKSPLDGDSWSGITDDEGRYEIAKVLLHKECKPFEITARLGQDEAWDGFWGPLEKPDPGYRYEKNLELVKGDLVGRFSVDITYVPGEHGEPRIARHSTFTAVGTWRYRPEESFGIIDHYRPEPLKVMYSFWERADDPTPNEGCPTLEWFLTGSGAASMPVWPEFDMAHPMGRLIVRGDVAVLGSHYEVHSPGLKQRFMVAGSERVGDTLPACKIYRPHDREILLGAFGIRAQLGPNGEMSGTDSWTSCGSADTAERIYFGVDHVQAALSGRGTAYQPKKAEGECHSGTTTLRVEWSFKKMRK
jgi:hypothetical protein